jgi:hypothetical protein
MAEGEEKRGGGGGLADEWLWRGIDVGPEFVRRQRAEEEAEAQGRGVGW